MKLVRLVWFASMFVLLIVLTFLLGVPSALTWIVRNFWRFGVAFAVAVWLLSAPFLLTVPGVLEARRLLIVGGVAAAGTLFAAVFLFISFRAWRTVGKGLTGHLDGVWVARRM